MAWEARRCRKYYYRRQNGRKVYVGTEVSAETDAEADALAQEARKTQRQQALAQLKILDALERAHDRISRNLDALLSQTLTAAGYHQHHRGEWRRKRLQKSSPRKTSFSALTKATSKPGPR